MDINSGDLSDPSVRSAYTISTKELTTWINSISARKQILILDACSSGSVAEDIVKSRNIPSSQIRALKRMQDRSGMFLIASSASNKVSFEASRFQQGLLTYSLLLGMSGAAVDINGNIDIVKLFQYSRDKVPEFALDIGGTQMPVLALPNDASSFDIGILNKNVKIKLEEVKPVFIRSNFQENSQFNDVLSISNLLDKYILENLGSQGIFIDTNSYNDAFSFKGRYALSNNKISVTGKLFKGDSIISDFNFEGLKEELNVLLEKILKVWYDK
jgi:hypothetical protein